MELINDYTYAIACLTSMGLRLTPADRMEAHNSEYFHLQATSAETNALNIAASLGENCLVMTKFVRDHPFALFIQRQLRARNLNYTGAEVEQGDPWGYRHQINIADSGYGLRGPKVWNDRAGEVGRTLSADEFDLDSIFKKERVGIFHITGLIAALSPSTTECCIQLAKAAKSQGSLVSFDLNYRESFWSGRKEELTKAFAALASLSDILIGNEEDFQLCLGLKGPASGGKDLANKIDDYQALLEQVQACYPNAKIIASTLREVLSANEHLWGACLFSEGTHSVVAPRPIQVYDRIGGGDAFSGGLLYGILKGWDPEKCLSFGWACGALAVASLNDYAEPVSENQVWNIFAGNARIDR